MGDRNGPEHANQKKNNNPLNNSAFSTKSRPSLKNTIGIPIRATSHEICRKETFAAVFKIVEL
jgi:hypothetical protein